MIVLPIGGADMPVVISLLNAFTGLSAAATGIALDNTAMIVAGMIVGASGTILTNLMAKAMNRSVPAIVAGGFGGEVAAPAAGAIDRGPVRSTSAQDVAIQLSYARLVVIAPGYGLAVAQAQHAVRELERALEAKGVEVKYAIHPVAGRMPGHMNVLLAEADVPYDLLKEMDEINPEFSRTDVTLVIGANDVTNPAAKNEPGSPIYGMPILEVDRSGVGDRAQALDGIRVRRHRQPAVLRAEDGDAVRRREVVSERDHLGGPGALAVAQLGAHRLASNRRSEENGSRRLKAIPAVLSSLRRGGPPPGRVRDRDEHRRRSDPDEAGRLLDRADRDRGRDRRRAAGRQARSPR